MSLTTYNYIWLKAFADTEAYEAVTIAAMALNRAETVLALVANSFYTGY